MKVQTEPIEVNLLVDNNQQEVLKIQNGEVITTSVETDSVETMEPNIQKPVPMRLSVSMGGGSGGPAEWGQITGNIEDQTDLKTELDSKIETELDPTVPVWAKQPTKPTYTATEVGALPSTTTIPSKTSDLTNDSGFITGISSTDVTTALGYTPYNSNNPDGFIDSIVQDLGDIDLDPYDYDMWDYLNQNLIVDTGNYKLHDIADDFYYYLIVQRSGNDVYQEWWCSEEGSLVRNCRNGRLIDEDEDEWEFYDSTYYLYGDALSDYYTKGQVYSKTEIDNTLGNYYTDVQVDDILDNNYYTSDQIDDMFDAFAPSNMIPTTWADLVDLRDDGELVPGAYYRITDYNFVTTKVNVQSGNHPFDIVVLAISENMLSENAYATRHAGDHYYEREVTSGGIQWLYTLYVDYMGEAYGEDPIDHLDDLHSTDEFVDSDVLPHPISGDDVPVLYKTNIEEYDLDDPDYEDAYFYEGIYDFDGDEYDMWSKYEYDGNEWQFIYQYALTPIVVEDGELIVSPHQETKLVPVNMNSWELKYCLDNDKTLFDWAVPEGKGVIYWMKDEFGNEAPYDFKNIMFRRKKINGVDNSILNSFTNQYYGEDSYYMIRCANDNKFFYTFVDAMDTTSDGSLFGVCNYTKIMPLITDGKRSLNDIVMYNAVNSFIDLNCQMCTFPGGFRDVTISSGCYNLLMQGTGSSIIGANAHDNTFIGFGNNKTGNNFSGNFGAQTSDCIFGSLNQNNNYGVSINGNQFGDGCFNNAIGNYSYGNKFGNSVTQCIFGTYCSYNNFEGHNSNLKFGNYYRYNTIEQTVSGITLNTSGGSTSYYVQYVKICKGVKNLTLTPTRNLNYETIYYKSGRTETAV